MTLLAAIVAENLGGTVSEVGRAVAVIMAFNGLGALIGALGGRQPARHHPAETA